MPKPRQRAALLDIGGTQTATGKHQPQDERRPAVRAERVVDVFPAAVDWILRNT